MQDQNTKQFYSPEDSPSKSEISFICFMFRNNRQYQYLVGHGQSMSQINTQWFSFTPAERLQQIAIKASQLEARKAIFLTPF